MRQRRSPLMGWWRAKEDDPGQPCTVENSVWLWTVAPVSEYIYSANPRDHVLHGNWLNLDHMVYYIFELKLDSNTWTPTSTWLWLVPKELKPRDMQAPTTSCSKQNNQDYANTSVGPCTTNGCHGFPTPAGGGKGLVHDTGNHSKAACMYKSEQGGRTRHQLGSFPCQGLNPEGGGDSRPGLLHESSSQQGKWSGRSQPQQGSSPTPGASNTKAKHHKDKNSLKGKPGK